MGLLTPCFVPRGGFLVQNDCTGGGGGGGGGRVAPFKSCPRGMVLDETDPCIIEHKIIQDLVRAKKRFTYI